jgi:glycosyltransferase involved in cell wall biosynthesis
MDNGGPATTVTDECGFRIVARDQDQVIDDVAAALRALAGSPDLRVRMGEAARRRVESEYLWSVKVEKMLAIYEEAIARRAAAGGGR